MTKTPMKLQKHQYSSTKPQSALIKG